LEELALELDSCAASNIMGESGGLALWKHWMMDWKCLEIIKNHLIRTSPSQKHRTATVAELNSCAYEKKALGNIYLREFNE